MEFALQALDAFASQCLSPFVHAVHFPQSRSSEHGKMSHNTTSTIQLQLGRGTNQPNSQKT